MQLPSIRAAVTALLLSVLAAAAAPAQEPLGGRWAVRWAEAWEATEVEGDAPAVHVALRTPGLNTFYIPLARLEGLAAEQLAARGAPAGFRLRRDAGTFTFQGTFGGGRGTGRFDFAPNPGFAAALVRRGMEPPTREQQFNLARHDTGLDLLDELAAQGYAPIGTELMLRAGLNGVDARYVREMGALGYRLGTLEALLRLRVHSVDGAFVQALAGAGYRGLSAGDLVSLRSHGVSADFVREVNRQAGRRLSVDELVRLRSRGER